MFYITVFLGGLLSFFSPCILPLLPIYLGYLGNYKENNKKNVIINTISFISGVSFVFIFLGLGFSTLGRMLYSSQFIISKISGVIIIVLGIFQFGFLKIKSLEKVKKINYKYNMNNPLAGFILGFTFSFAWTPCIGPILSSILLMVGNVENTKIGLLLILIYTFGFIIPFLLTGIFTDYFLKLFKKNNKIMKLSKIFIGLLLIVIGFLILTNKLNQLINLLL